MLDLLEKPDGCEREVTSPEPGRPDFPDATLDPRRWLALPVILTAAFLSVLDFFIVNVSIPAMQRDLQASNAEIQFVIAGYALAYAVGLITGGRLGDVWGRKRMFVSGLAAFTLASVLCGAAPTAVSLLTARIFQGLAASIMIPQGLAILQVSFAPREKNVVFASYGAALGMAAIAGQLFGGILVHADLFGLTWRPIFLVNLPIGCSACVGAVVLLQESRSNTARKLDLAGVAIVSIGLLLFTYPLVEGREAGWPHWSYYCFIASLPTMAAFVMFERALESRGGAPLMELNLFANRAFSVGLAITLVFFGGLSSFFLTLTLYLQRGLGYDPLRAGLTVVPFAIGFFSSSAFSVTIKRLLGLRTLQLGAGMMVVGLLALIHQVHIHGIALHRRDVFPVLLFYGLGQGLVLSPLYNAVLSGIEPRDAGSASGVLSTVQQIAGALGVAGIGIVYFGVLGPRPDTATYVQAFTTALRANIALLALTFLLVFLLPAINFNADTVLVDA